MGRASLLLLFMTPWTLGQQIPSTHEAQQPAGVATPLFELEQSEPSAGVRNEGITIDPVLLLSGKHIEEVPDQCQPGAEKDAFDNAYLKPGKNYTVIFGGAEAGTATIKPNEVDFVDTRVELSKSVPIHGLNMALAGPRYLAHSSGLRRDLTSDERTLARGVAEKILASKGVSGRDIQRLALDQAVMIEFSSDVTKVVAAVEVERPDKFGIEFSLTFTADRDGGNPSTLWYQHAQSETEAEALYMVDVVDLDGDGSNELVARRVFYENYRYEVYKREKSGWERILNTGILGCE
jgi:hypothetical protein